MTDWALEAAEAAFYATPATAVMPEPLKRAVAAYLDSLLGDIPITIVALTAKANYERSVADRTTHTHVVSWERLSGDAREHHCAIAKRRIQDALRSLRTNLGDTVRKGGG